MTPIKRHIARLERDISLCDRLIQTDRLLISNQLRCGDWLNCESPANEGMERIVIHREFAQNRLEYWKSKI